MVAAILCCAMTTTVFTACTDNDDNPADPDTPTAQAEYAILFYGYGGSTLDEGIMQNMIDFYKGKAGSYNQVKIAAQYKYSSIEDIKEYMLDEGVANGTITQEKADELYVQMKPMDLQTIRFIVDPTINNAKDDVLLNPEYIYGERNCDIANVDSLTNFINWATEACPAKHYILIASDHGGGYLPHYERPFEAPAQTRALIFDHTDKPLMYFTASSFKYAVSRANKRMDVIYMDACLMNNIEYQFELKDVTDYLILSTFLVPNAGGSYTALVDELAQNAANLETALSNFNKASVEKWDQDAAEQAAAGNEDAKWDYHDMTVTRTRNLDAFGSKFKVFVDRLVAAYADEDNKAKIDAITKSAFKVNNDCPSYDIVDYAQAITLMLPNVYDAAFANELGTSFNNCLVSQYCSDFLMNNNLSVDCSIMLAVQGNYYYYDYDDDDPKILNGYDIYYADGKRESYITGETEPIVSTWSSTLPNTYEQLAFDKATGWSRWLYLNEQLPCENSPVEMHYPIGN